jgi:hypothetical protein
MITIIAVYGFVASADEPSMPHEVKKGLLGRGHPALRGIRTVVFILNHSGSEPNGPALWETIATKVTKQLGEADIGWLKPDHGGAGSLGIPAYILTIETLKLENSKKHVFRVRTSLAADVCLKDDSSTCLKAELWEVSSPMRAVTTRDAGLIITKEVLQQTEAFTLAHSAANQPGMDKPAAPPKSKAVSERDARRARRIPAEYLYVASKRGKVFHRPDCISAKRISPKNLVGFTTREEAVNTGRHPCKRCNP